MEESPNMRLREAALQLTEVRSRPCFLIAAESIQPPVVRELQHLIHQTKGSSADVIIFGGGGCACCAYATARDLRRRFEHLAVYVPWLAKSALTFIALAADDLVLGNRGELGPLDAQYSEKQPADFPAERSCLEGVVVLRQLQAQALEMFDEVTHSLVEKSQMRGQDACQAATELVARMWEPLLRRIEPKSLANSLRGMELSRAYAERLLRRYRPQLYAEAGHQIIENLVAGYPTHDYLIDREELDDIGLPARAPTEQETDAVESVADVLWQFGRELRCVEVVDPAREAGAIADGGTKERRLLAIPPLVETA